MRLLLNLIRQGVRCPAGALWLALALPAGLPVFVYASELRIGVKVGPSAIDPHYHASGENSSILPHIYDGLLTLDDNLDVAPALAVKWGPVSDTIWEFELRRDVRFHNGAPFTAQDVLFTFNRVPEVENSPGSFEIYTRRVARVEVVNDYLVRFHTEVPQPFLDHDLSGLMIIPHELPLDVDTGEFNSGRAAIGTGPYRLESWAPGRTLTLVRNENYWGGQPDWDQVQLIPINSDPTRVAALLNGDVDVIEHVPLADRRRLAEDPAITLYEAQAARLMFVHLDSARDISPHVRSIDGKALATNPLRDPRVRRALSLAIDRQAIIDYLLDGSGAVAVQILPSSFSGSSQKLKPEPVNKQRAAELLAEAGYPDGFQITLHSPSGRYPNDAKIAQAIAQMWWRIGVITEVVVMTPNVFFPAAAKQDFSAYFAGWGQTTVANALAGLVHTYDRATGLGSGNRARYSNLEVDGLLKSAMSSHDVDRRQSQLARAQEIVFREDQGLIPLYHPVYGWAAHTRTISYLANSQGVTQAMRVTRAGN